MSNMSSIHATEPASLDPMDMLFGEFHAVFGNPFLDKFRSGHIEEGKDTGIENMKSVWADKIRANGLRMADIKRGIKGLERCRYGAPNWSEFLELCRPTPKLDDAIVEAIAQLQARRDGTDTWSHPAIYWAAMKVGYYEMNNLSHSQLRPRFESALAKILESDVPPVPPISLTPALPAPVQTPLELAQAKEHLADLKLQTVFKRPTDTFDHLSWARRILDREKRGDTTVSLYQLKEAREAMRVHA